MIVHSHGGASDGGSVDNGCGGGVGEVVVNIHRERSFFITMGVGC